jgi:two-component system, cell cycle sensor histidine kinase and response regulator CckA
MDAEIEAHIFEPFFTTKELGVSSGLGLSTVHGIVGQSGGTIAVESAPARGSVFTVRLPLAAAAATLVD